MQPLAKIVQDQHENFLGKKEKEGIFVEDPRMNNERLCDHTLFMRSILVASSSLTCCAQTLRESVSDAFWLPIVPNESTSIVRDASFGRGEAGFRKFLTALCFSLLAEATSESLIYSRGYGNGQ